jgi:peptide-methionine (S)-S-oxide reductase
MEPSDSLDLLFREAVAAIDRGDLPKLEGLLAAHPELVSRRLAAPGEWLRGQVGGALDGFFHEPYLLWFVAEDPVRNGKLPENIAAVARAIVAAARRHAADSFQEQIDTALQLTSWSWIARECGVQIALMDVLLDAGASPHGNPDAAIVNGNFEAAEHLLARGAALTLGAALCLGHTEDLPRLTQAASDRERQYALVLAALKGKADGVRWMLQHGGRCEPPERHAVRARHPAPPCRLLRISRHGPGAREAGASVRAQDSAWKSTPLGWAENYLEDDKRKEGRQYAEIAAYLRTK